MILRLAFKPAARFDALVLLVAMASLYKCLRFVSDTDAYAHMLLLMLQ